MDTTIKVDTQVRDRLALLARERGVSMRDLVGELARSVPTGDELRDRAARAENYIRSRLAPDLSDADLDGAEDTWAAIEAGDVPEALSPETGRWAA